MRDEDDWDEEGDEEPDSVECFYCKAEMFYDAELCPQCGNFQVDSDAEPQQRPGWILWTAILLIAIFLGAALIPALGLIGEKANP